MVIETAVESSADVIVSEDKDLTDDPAVAEFLRHFGIRVLTLAQFLDVLQVP
jgi:predicted nucleic acid-binding protein